MQVCRWNADLAHYFDHSRSREPSDSNPGNGSDCTTFTSCRACTNGFLEASQSKADAECCWGSVTTLRRV